MHSAAARAVSNAAPASPVVAAKPVASDTVLVNALDAELQRAMSSLGADGAAAAQQPKPYFISYAVDDATAVSIAAEYGAITNSNQGRVRSVDVQVRLGSPAEDNTHGDHRNSALTTLPLPLTDDRDAIARSLWYATNRGYARALDGYLKVKTEAEVRAKEEDTSADFSMEQPQTDMLHARSGTGGGPSGVGAARARDLAVFRAISRCISDQVELRRQNETDYFVSSEGSRVATPHQKARLVIVARDPRRRRHGPLPRADLRGRNGGRLARAGGAGSGDARWRRAWKRCARRR